MSIFKDQAGFMSRGNQNIAGGDIPQSELYAGLIAEEHAEFKETQESFYIGRPSDEIKEAVDVIVVAAGFLISALGTDGAQKAWDLVLAANHRKLDGPIVKRDDGKIMQTPEYKAKVKEELADSLDTLVAEIYS